MDFFKKRWPPVLTDVIWHAAKTGLCLLQLLCLVNTARDSVATLIWSMTEEMSLGFALLYLGVSLVYFMVLWRYYDSIDDRSFNRFCAVENEPVLLRSTAYIIGLGMTVVLGAWILCHPVVITLTFLLPVSMARWFSVLGYGVAALFVGGVSIWRILRLNYRWGVQKNLRRSTDKPHKLIPRILYAVVFFVALILLTMVGIETFLPIYGSVLRAAVLLLLGPLLVIAGVLLGWQIVHVGLRMRERKRYLNRLANLQAAGELTFTVHGYPYRSLISNRYSFGLSVTDAPHPESKVQERRSYQVAFANCNRRRMAVILCENNVYQIMFNIKIRAIGALGMGNMNGEVMTVPLGSWFINRTYEFPEGCGERILVVDPAPHSLWMRGFRGELLSLDNGSVLYGFTVYGKNAFLDLLERS